MKKRVVSIIGISLCVLIIITSLPLLSSAYQSESSDETGGKASDKEKVDISLRGIGDVDGSGLVDVDDAMLMQRQIAGLTDGEVESVDESDERVMMIADLNCDNVLSVGDVTIIQQIAAEKIPVTGGDWEQTPEAVRNYLANANYSSSDYSYSVIQKYAPALPQAVNMQPVGFTIQTNGGSLLYNGNARKVTAGEVKIYNDVPNTKTKYTLSANGSVYQIGTLRLTHFLRQIKCESAPNVRDLGGWSCDGGSVKYGMLYRGGAPQAADRDVLVNQCGVRSEIDLRGMNDSSVVLPDKSYLGDDVDYYKFPRYTWYSLKDTELWRMMLRATFDSVKKNKPVYFHCAAGADRTGTFACVLESLLGMEPGDIDKDYELTSFYSGTYSDAAARRRDEGEWKNFVAEICAKAPKGSKKPMRDGAVKFAIELGFSIEDINAFRAAAIDGDPEILKLIKYI